jgi:hypothetical protein
MDSRPTFVFDQFPIFTHGTVFRRRSGKQHTRTQTRIRYKKSTQSLTVFTARTSTLFERRDFLHAGMPFRLGGSLQAAPPPSTSPTFQYSAFGMAARSGNGLKRSTNAAASLPSYATVNDNAVSPEDVAAFNQLQSASYRAKQKEKIRVDLFNEPTYEPITADGTYWAHPIPLGKSIWIELCSMEPWNEPSLPFDADDVDEQGNPKHFYAYAAYRCSFPKEVLGGMVKKQDKLFDLITIAEEQVKNETAQVQLSMQAASKNPKQHATSNSKQ